MYLYFSNKFSIYYYLF